MTSYIDTKLAPIIDSLSSVSKSTKKVDIEPQKKRRKIHSSMSRSRSRSRSPVPLTSKKSRLTSKRPRSPSSSKSRSPSGSPKCDRKARFSRPLYRRSSQSLSRSRSRSPEVTFRRSRKVSSRRLRSNSISRSESRSRSRSLERVKSKCPHRETVKRRSSTSPSFNIHSSKRRRSPSPCSRSSSRSVERELSSEEESQGLNISLQDQLVQIQKLFPDRISMSVASKKDTIRPTSEIREPEVSGLPLHDLISENLEIMSSNINEGSMVKSAISKESSALPPGRFPPSNRLHRRYDPSDNKDFKFNPREDSHLNQLFFTQTRFKSVRDNPCISLEKSAKITSEIKKAMAVSSWGLWFTSATNSLLRELHQSLTERSINVPDTLEWIKMLLNLNCTSLNSAKESTGYLTSALSYNILSQRDAYLMNMDKDLSEDSKIDLRSAPLDGNTLFQGKVESAIESLAASKKKEQKVVVKVGFDPKSKRQERSVETFSKRSSFRPDRSSGSKPNPSKKSWPASSSWPSSSSWNKSKPAKDNNQTSTRGRGRGRGGSRGRGFKKF